MNEILKFRRIVTYQQVSNAVEELLKRGLVYNTFYGESDKCQTRNDMRASTEDEYEEIAYAVLEANAEVIECEGIDINEYYGYVNLWQTVGEERRIVQISLEKFNSEWEQI